VEIADAGWGPAYVEASETRSFSFLTAPTTFFECRFVFDATHINAMPAARKGQDHELKTTHAFVSDANGTTLSEW
jgi:hypothetical protein